MKRQSAQGGEKDDDGDNSPIPAKIAKNKKNKKKNGDINKEKHGWGEEVTTVTCNNASEIEGEFMAWLKKAAFAGVDTEFTGLKTMHYSDAAAKLILSRETKDMESRYVIYKDVVTNHSLLSIGVSFWQEEKNEEKNEKGETKKGHYKTRTYSFLVMRDALTIEVSPQSLIFLATHGMDFNMLFSSSIPYVTPPPAPKSSAAGPLGRMMRALLTGTSTPVVFHNGFLDLLYLYHSFVGPLPENVTEFCKALSKTFAHVFDTRFIAERIAREDNASLGEIFGKCWADNAETHVIVIEDHKEETETEIEEEEEEKEEKCNEGSTEKGSPGMALHNADFDAYSTAFVFAFYKAVSEKVETEAKDKIFLPGKNFPMAIPRQKPI